MLAVGVGGSKVDIIHLFDILISGKKLLRDDGKEEGGGFFL